MTAIDTVKKVYQFDAPRFAALEFTDPSVTVLAEIRRSNHDSFESTVMPTDADLTVLAANGGAAEIKGVDLKAAGPEELLDIIAAALSTAHAAGLHDENAALFGKMMIDAATARHLVRNLERV
jgi:hypothetical protein